MHRRQLLLALLGSSLPINFLFAQQSLPVVGFLSGASAKGYSGAADAFRIGLEQSGFADGKNIKIEHRWAEGNYDQLPALLTNLVNGGARVIAATTTPAALAAKAAKLSIPVVFETSGDPVTLGLVESLSKPGINLTGVTQLNSQLISKRLGIINAMMPSAKQIGFLVNPRDPRTERQIKDMIDAGKELGVTIVVATAASASEFDVAFGFLKERGAGATVVASDSFFNSQSKLLVSAASRAKMPAMYQLGQFVHDGGLMSYGTDVAEAYRQVGIYVAQILKGAKPAELPVIQSLKFEFIINAKAAEELNIIIPSALLAMADSIV